MSYLTFNNVSKSKQYFISIALILFVATICYLISGYIGYKVVAFILLVTVSLLAMIFDILPVFLAALLSALVWDFFFIPPHYTFSVGSTEDAIMLAMYFIIVLLHAALTYKIRQMEKKANIKDEKEKTIKLYGTILNSLSHELRTPIATIVGTIDAIKENNSKLSDANKSELLHEIEIAGYRLNRQVENLLNMSRLEAGVLKPNVDWCDVNELIYSVIKHIKSDADKHIIIFSANDKLPLFKLDRGIVEQVLQNILHNALQYTPETSTITIEVFRNESNCVFTISDNGPGIPESEITTVFDKFYRLSQNITGGTGLGLSIAKGFTESMNGIIKLENNQAGGAKFTITIPAETSFLKV